MKQEDVPQDPGALGKISREVCYAINEDGRYVTQLSRGWEVKASALDTAWQDIEKRADAAKEKIRNHEASPLLYFMEKCSMDTKILSGYTGIWKWAIKRHLKPDVFAKLSDKTLQRYAAAFNVTIEDLKLGNI